MHKSYQSTLPCQSRILKERWDRKYYEEHRYKVREAKPMVDNKPPTTYLHLHLKPKKLQLEEERLATIERDNRILLEKMSQIMRTKGRIDNHNDYISKSLNREKRRKELLRVTRENQEILKRILSREPEYNHLQWDREWDENEQFMDNISRYPRNWWEVQKEEEERRQYEKQKKRKDEKRRKSKKRSRSQDEKSLDATEKGAAAERENEVTKIEEEELEATERDGEVTKIEEEEATERDEEATMPESAEEQKVAQEIATA